MSSNPQKPSKTHRRRRNPVLLRHFRDREWARTPGAHDEIARGILDPSHSPDPRLSPWRRRAVEYAVRAEAEEPGSILRFGLEAAFDRVAQPRS